MKMRKPLCQTIILLALGLFLSACSTRFVHFKEDPAVSRALESHTVLPGYNYYYSGSDTIPVAILGVRKEYNLTTELWHPIKLTQAQLKEWMDMIDNAYRERIMMYRGKYIFTEDGKEIGIWYSPMEWTTVRVGPDNSVEIYTPPISYSDSIMRTEKGLHRKIKR